MKNLSFDQQDSLLNKKLNDIKVQFEIINFESTDTTLVHSGIFMAFEPENNSNILTSTKTKSNQLLPEYFESYPSAFPVFIMNSKKRNPSKI